MRIELAHDTGRIAGKRREEKAVGDNHVSLHQCGHNLVLEPMTEVGGMQETEFLLIDGPHIFPRFDDRLDELRRIPLRRFNCVSLAREPVLEELSLGRLAGTIGTFERDQETPVFSLLLNFLTEPFRLYLRVFCHL